MAIHLRRGRPSSPDMAIAIPVTIENTTEKNNNILEAVNYRKSRKETIYFFSIRNTAQTPR
jgi:hypothetical protein